MFESFDENMIHLIFCKVYQMHDTYYDSSFRFEYEYLIDTQQISETQLDRVWFMHNQVQVEGE